VDVIGTRPGQLRLVPVDGGKFEKIGTPGMLLFVNIPLTFILSTQSMLGMFS
jgi:hypothetical protein